MEFDSSDASLQQCFLARTSCFEAYPVPEATDNLNGLSPSLTLSLSLSRRIHFAGAQSIEFDSHQSEIFVRP